jgi:hypothetical protein
MAEEEGIFGTFIDWIASIFEAFGIEHESAEKYAKILVYGGTALIIFIFVIWIIRVVRGK